MSYWNKCFDLVLIVNGEQTKTNDLSAAIVFNDFEEIGSVSISELILLRMSEKSHTSFSQISLYACELCFLWVIFFLQIHRLYIKDQYFPTPHCIARYTIQWWCLHWWCLHSANSCNHQKYDYQCCTQTWEKTQNNRRQILEVHKLPQKVRDHDMCILQKCATKLTKKAKIYLQITKIGQKIKLLWKFLKLTKKKN